MDVDLLGKHLRISAIYCQLFMSHSLQFKNSYELAV